MIDEQNGDLPVECDPRRWTIQYQNLVVCNSCVNTVISCPLEIVDSLRPTIECPWHSLRQRNAYVACPIRSSLLGYTQAALQVS